MKRLFRNPAAILLTVVLALLPIGAWAERSDGSTIDTGAPADGLGGITWSGAVAPDGRLSVRIAYDFDDEVTHEIDIRVPDGARYLALNGTPISASIGKYTTVSAADEAVVTYELPGRVSRYTDGALVRLAGEYDSAGDLQLDGDQAMFVCPRCYIDGIGYGDTAVSGALFAPGASEAVLLFAGLDPVRAASSDTEPDAIQFVGNDTGTDDVSMLAILPASAVPDLQRQDGDVADAVAEFRSQFEDADDRFRVAGGSGATAADDDSGTTTAVVLTALFAGLVIVIGGRRLWGVVVDRRSAADATPEYAVGVEVPRPVGRSAQPSDLEPALAGLVIGDYGSGRRSFVAATILELARRDVISIRGTDERRFTIDIPAEATGDTPFERAVLTQMRPLGKNPQPPKATELTGPPLWHSRALTVTRILHRALVREAIAQKLMRSSRIVLLAAPVAIAMGVVAIVGSDELTLLAWLTITLGPILAALATARAGVALTGLGRRERDRWCEYADWLAGDPELKRAAPTRIDELGVPFVYAAALGAARTAADALSPGPTTVR